MSAPDLTLPALYYIAGCLIVHALVVFGFLLVYIVITFISCFTIELALSRR